MIQVKGIRSKGADPDPADPLGMRKAPAPGTGVLSLVTGGIVGLAVYLKSFLWAHSGTLEPGAAQPPGPPPEGTPARPKAALKLLPQQAAEDSPGRRDAGEPEDGSPPPRLPAVFGPFETGVFAPPPEVGSIGPVRVAANATLPPFRGLGPGSANDGGPGGAPSPAPPVPLPRLGPDEIVLPDPGDGEDPPPADTSGGGTAPATSGDGTAPARNRAPRNTGPVHLGDVGSGAALAIALAHLLSRTSDPDGDALSVTMGGASAGSVDLRAWGWRYLADTDHLGEITISYTVSDGALAVAQTASATIVENVFLGTGADDLIVGTMGRDVIRGGAGDDNLAGLGGRDLIQGEAGDDNIAGGDGDDTLSGGDGDDLIAGGAGHDWISGGRGNDRLYGEAGNDVIYGDEGDDVLDGGAGDDVLFGGEGDDLVEGGAGNDILSGDAGADTLDGGAGDDILSGGAGADVVRGGAGDDVVLADDDGAADRYDGGEGTDRLDYSASTASVFLDLIAGTARGASVGEDSFEGFEQIVGSAGNDSFLAAGGSGTLTGNGGADLYHFVPGDVVVTEPSVYRLTDFGLDDLIWIGNATTTKQIRKAQKALEERIDDFFDDFAGEVGADEPALRFSHDWTDDYQRTLIEVDFDRDDRVDLALLLDGEHFLVVEQA